MNENNVGEGAGPVAFAFLTIILALVQFVVLAFQVAECWGGCSAKQFPSVLFLGALACAAWFTVYRSIRQFGRAGSFGKLVAVLLLIPGGFGAAVSTVVVVFVLVSIASTGIKHLLR